jgi:hypothetical protein
LFFVLQCARIYYRIPHPTHVLIRVELLKEKSGTPLPTKSFIFRRAAYVYMRGERAKDLPKPHNIQKDFLNKKMRPEGFFVMSVRRRARILSLNSPF